MLLEGQSDNEMPFFAQREEMYADYVIPEEVDDGETVFCPTCSGRMRPRGGDQRARHFMHIENLKRGEGTDCPGVDDVVGESEIHRKLKSLAVSGLRERFVEKEIQRCGPEEKVQIYRGELDIQIRRADALIEFRDENPFFGDGVVIEVQYRNLDKDIPQVTADYLREGFSVFWARENDFSENSFDLDRFEQAFSDRVATAFAPYYSDPDETKLILEAEMYELGTWMFRDPEPDCHHSWHTAGMSGFCLNCGATRRHHEEADRTVYEPRGAEGPPRRRQDSPFK
ncbi:hypothetical protein GWK26_08710 [haloarchaeon 3A1-DGR]|nr:hypothetical protein GWK26_08710 [haloarchaeon 3A1-DGR]